jgi:hypothetical protein
MRLMIEFKTMIELKDQKSDKRLKEMGRKKSEKGVKKNRLN